MKPKVVGKVRPFSQLARIVEVREVAAVLPETAVAVLNPKRARSQSMERDCERDLVTLAALVSQAVPTRVDGCR